MGPTQNMMVGIASNATMTKTMLKQLIGDKIFELENSMVKTQLNKGFSCGRVGCGSCGTMNQSSSPFNNKSLLEKYLFVGDIKPYSNPGFSKPSQALSSNNLLSYSDDEDDVPSLPDFEEATVIEEVE